MKNKVLFLLIILIIILQISNLVLAGNIIDIDEHWAKNEITRMINNNAIDGYEDNTFRPDESITVLEFLKLLIEAGKIDKTLIGDRWPNWYIETAKDKNLIYENENININAKITRYEAAKIISRYINISTVKESKNMFTDLEKEYKSEVLKLTKLNVISGYEDKTFRGKESITRAESTKIINKAVDARRTIVHSKNISFKNSERLTNINETPQYNSLYVNRYDIKNSKIYFYDNGRYFNITGYSIKEERITNKILINLIQILITEDNYTCVSYVPDSSENNLNQIIITYGEKEKYMYNGLYAFEYIFYEDKLFELSRIALDNDFSSSCFMKISVSRLWKENDEIINKKYINGFNEDKLRKSLKIIFDEITGNKIADYIISKVPESYERNLSIPMKEVIKIGKYTLNLHAINGTVLDFYVSKLN